MLDVLPKRHRHRLHNEPEWTGQPVIERVAGQVSLDGARVEAVRRDAVCCE